MPTQNFCRTKAEAAAKLIKRKAVATNHEEVLCNGGILENIFLFKYLGSIFAANGSQVHDVDKELL